MILIIGALDEYRALLRDNHDTAVFAEERTDFARQLAMVNEMLNSFGADDPSTPVGGRQA